MAGQLLHDGYELTDDPVSADIILVNSCTVKSPSQQSFLHTVRTFRAQGKRLIVAGCVPQGQPNHPDLQGLSTIGVQQIDRIAEAARMTLDGQAVRWLGKERKPGLDLPKQRQNPLIEIIPINTGCLSACTYCKTKHARGHLSSHAPEKIVERALAAVREGAKEIWITSEDTGAYGKDVGSSLPKMLTLLTDSLPDEVMVRIGMTNPPYILDMLEEMTNVLRRPNVYSFLHIPVQSGSNEVLAAMKRGYTADEFCRICDHILREVPGITIATDIICGFPSESEEDFQQTMNLLERYRFPIVNISQFYPRPNTPAARMRLLPTTIVKERSRKATRVFESYTPYADLVGSEQDILITQLARDKKHLVGHTGSYVQALIPRDDSLLGKRLKARIMEAEKFCIKGVPIPQPPSK